jgi:hypothetical protein
MMAQWAETCRRIFNIEYQYMLCLLTEKKYYIITKHNGMAPIKNTNTLCYVFDPSHVQKRCLTIWRLTATLVVVPHR